MNLEELSARLGAIQKVIIQQFDKIRAELGCEIDRAPVKGGTGAPRGEQIFEETFPDGIDPDRWITKLRWPRKDIINGEKQIYTDSAHSGVHPFSKAATGGLNIVCDEADEENPVFRGQKYTSGAICTYGAFSQQYGYFEADVTLPIGKGLWGAFWLMPVGEDWPPEIDIFEHRGNPNQFNVGVHEKSGSSSHAEAIVEGQRHRFGMLWTPNKLVSYIDEKVVWEKEGHSIHEPMYMILNLAIGSDKPHWVPDPDETTPLPARMTVHRVSAWSLKDHLAVEQ